MDSQSRLTARSARPEGDHPAPSARRHSRRSGFRPRLDELEGRVVPSYVMTDLGVLGGIVRSSEATGINAHGQVVGYSTTASGDYHAFLYSGGPMVDLGTLGGSSSSAAAINDHGQVVGHSTTASGADHAFLYSGGPLVDLGTLGGTFSAATGINDLGQVVGYSTNASGFRHAFLYSGGPLVDLGTLSGGTSEATGINDLGQVVGHSSILGVADHAFVSSGGPMVDLGTLGGKFSVATGINDLGQVVGGSSNASGASHAFLDSGGAMRDLGTLGGTFSEADGINAKGQVVGYSTTASRADHAFLSSGGSMVDLGTLGGGTFSAATGINAKGQVVGYSTTASGDYHAFIASPVLTPAFAVPAAQTLVLHTASITLAGTLTARNPGGGVVVPPTIETITVTLHGVSHKATIRAGGRFSVAFATAGLPAGAFKVSYDYRGDATLRPATASSTVDVRYKVVLVAPTAAVRAGTPAPVTLLLADFRGANRGSSATTVTAVALSGPKGKPAPLVNAGGAKLGLGFHYNAKTRRYAFDLRTTGFKPGTYTLRVKAGSDPTKQFVTFSIR